MTLWGAVAIGFVAVGLPFIAVFVAPIVGALLHYRTRRRNNRTE